MPGAHLGSSVCLIQSVGKEDVVTGGGGGGGGGEGEGEVGADKRGG